jgi:hypothetical protein
VSDTSLAAGVPYPREEFSWRDVCPDFPPVHNVLGVLGVPSHRPRPVSLVVTSRVGRLLRGYLQYPLAEQRFCRFEHCLGSRSADAALGTAISGRPSTKARNRVDDVCWRANQIGLLCVSGVERSVRGQGLTAGGKIEAGGVFSRGDSAIAEIDPIGVRGVEWWLSESQVDFLSRQRFRRSSRERNLPRPNPPASKLLHF